MQAHPANNTQMMHGTFGKVSLMQACRKQGELMHHAVACECMYLKRMSLMTGSQTEDRRPVFRVLTTACRSHLWHVILLACVLQFRDPAVISELNSDDCNTIKLVDVIKLLVLSPLLRYQSFSTCNMFTVNLAVKGYLQYADDRSDSIFTHDSQAVGHDTC